MTDTIKVTPAALHELADKQNEIKRQKAVQQLKEKRKQVNQSMINAALEGKYYAFIEKPIDKYEQEILAESLRNDGFLVNDTYFHDSFKVSWENTKPILSDAVTKIQRYEKQYIHDLDPIAGLNPISNLDKGIEEVYDEIRRGIIR